MKCNDKKIEGNARNNDELTEHECEIEFFNLLINECVCNNLCNVCLHALTHEEDKILQEKAKEESKQWKEKFYAKKIVKKKKR